MLYLGIIVGLTSGFLLAWWFAGKGPPPEPFFSHLLRLEKRSARLDRRLALHELHAQVDDLSRWSRQTDLQLQELRKKVALLGGTGKPALKEPDRGAEILRLSEEGFSSGEIARRLKLGKGEVEFALNLKNKPSRVINFQGFKE